MGSIGIKSHPLPGLIKDYIEVFRSCKCEKLFFDAFFHYYFYLTSIDMRS